MVKRRDLMAAISDFAHQNELPLAIAEGSNHTRVTVGERRTVVPRHREINEITAKAIRKQLGMEER